MFELSDANVHWYWFSAGILLIALEAFVPGAVLLWFGVAAMLTGGLSLLADLSLNSQMIFFSVVALSSTAVFKYWQHKRPPDEDDAAELLNHPGQALIGRRLRLVTPLENGSGRVAVADSSWRCRGPDLPQGSTVTVTGVEGSTLVVEKAEDA